jgi:Tfp pilus assembly protein PilF
LIVLVAAGCGRSERAALDAARTAREAAYSANNRGTGLLEQFAYDQAIAAFQEALRIDPSVRLARINLAIAQFYAGRTDEAAVNAEEAQADYPDAPEPAFLLGLIAKARNQPDQAIRQFERVLRVDRDDPGTRINLAMVLLDQRRYREAATLAESALAIEPYNATAAYTVAIATTRMGDTKAGARALVRFEQLRAAPYAITYSQSYLEQGRYAEAVASTGAEPGLVSTALPSVTFADATRSLAGSTTPERPRTGAVTLADIDGDGDLDILGGGASLRVLRNDRSGFVEVTARVLPAPLIDIIGLAAGDLNNDGRVDLLALTLETAHLLVQDTEGRFLLAQRLNGPNGWARTGALADVDHDGDLDVVVAGQTAALLRNNGNGSFSDVTAAAGIDVTGDVVSVVPTDFDNRRDIDLAVAARGRRPMMFRNLRTGVFADVGAAIGMPAAGDYTSMVAGDVNKDGFTDLLLGSASAPALWILSDRAGRYRQSDAPAATRAMTAAQLFDYDNDGLIDLFALTAGKAHMFRNTGAGWQEHAAVVSAIQGAIGSQPASPAVAAGDLDLDGDTDLVPVFTGGALRLWRNDGGNAQRAVQLALAGRASNRAGVGAKIELRAGSLYQRIETTAATPPATPADITLGLGTRPGPDVIRVLWPSGVLQTELSTVPAADARPARVTVTELDRKASSCPYLFTWNGSEFEFVTDFLGGGEMGYLETPPAHRNVPDPDEYVRITDTQLQERDGRFEIRVTNELEEVLFLDHVALLPVSHPGDLEVFPDEGMRLRPPLARTYRVSQARPPRAAVDDANDDVLELIARRDQRFVDDFDRLSVRGYAREHAVTLDVSSAPPRSLGARTVLLLTGWTDYAFSSDNVSAHQAGLTLLPPALQVETSGGRFETVVADVGIPVGRPQTIVVDITPYAARRVRLVTSMRVYWDQILVGTATVDTRLPSPLPLAAAGLRWRGFSKAASISGQPLSYQYTAVSRSTPWKLMPGRYTREGDVRELLHRADDRLVIARPGDELVLSFDASAVPPLAPGTRRTFLLYGVGFSKEMDLHSASPDVVQPIPFRAMRTYPFEPPDRYPHPGDIDTFHTRVVPRTIPPLLAEDQER